MKQGRILAVIFLISALSGRAQLASEYVHEKMMDSIVQLYNQQRFRDIYALGTDDLQGSIKETELVNYFKNDLFALYGPVIGWKLSAEEKGRFSYELNCRNERLATHLAVTENRKISYLKFFLYPEVYGMKRSSFFSDNKKLSKLDSLVDSTVTAYIQSPQNCGLSIGVTVNDQNYFYNYGEIRKDSKIFCSPSSIYEIASLTKTFCGILFAKAIVEGKLNTDDELSKFLPGKYPGLSLNGKNILLKHLANHTSGLPGIPEDLASHPDFDSLNPYKNYTKIMLHSYLKTVKLESEPGKQFSYSNTGMALLGLVLEEVYGKSFEELVKEKICIPNGMQNTTIQLSPEQQEIFAQGYNSEGSPTPHLDLGVFRASGALRSNTEDMIKFLNYNSKEEDKAIVSAHSPTFTGKLTVGLSWFIKKTKFSNTLIWQNGGSEGFRSFAGFIKEKKCSVVVLSNSAMDVDYIAIAILDFLQK